MLEKLFVGLIVATAAGYAAWTLVPAPTRKRLALGTAGKLGGPTATGARGLVASWLHRIANAPAGGCSDCPAHTLTPAERAQPKEPGQ